MIPLPQATRDAKEACGRAIHQNREPYWENTNELSIKTISLPPQKKKKKPAPSQHVLQEIPINMIISFF